MANTESMKELLNMPAKDLDREVRSQRVNVAKAKLSVSIGKEKNTAKYAKAKKHLARMLTAQNEIRRKSLSASDSASTVPARS